MLQKYGNVPEKTCTLYWFSMQNCNEKCSTLLQENFFPIKCYESKVCSCRWQNFGLKYLALNLRQVLTFLLRFLTDYNISNGVSSKKSQSCQVLTKTRCNMRPFSKIKEQEDVRFFTIQDNNDVIIRGLFLYFSVIYILNCLT